MLLETSFGSHLALQQPRPVVEPCGKIWVIRAQGFLPNLNSSKVERVGFVKLALKHEGRAGWGVVVIPSRVYCGGTNAQQPRPVVETFGQVWVVRPEGLLIKFDHSHIQSVRLVVLTLEFKLGGSKCAWR